MAQTWIDFSSDSGKLQGPPADSEWEIVGETSSSVFRLVEDPALDNIQCLDARSSSGNWSRYMRRVAPIHTDIHVKQRIWIGFPGAGTTVSPRYMIRGGLSNYEGYRVAIGQAFNSTIQFATIIGGSLSTRASAATGVNWTQNSNSHNIPCIIEYRMDGNRFRGRFYVDGGPVPDWHLDYTDTENFFSSGYDGILNNYTAPAPYTHWYSVGTNGDTAPDGPVGGLTAPTLTAPANSVTGVALRPTFTWS